MALLLQSGCSIIKTHSRVSCGQEKTREHKCVIYVNQNYADFSLLYLKSYHTDFYEIYIFYALRIPYLTYQI